MFHDYTTRAVPPDGIEPSQPLRAWRLRPLSFPIEYGGSTTGARRELHPRHADYESVALLLSYEPEVGPPRFERGATRPHRARLPSYPTDPERTPRDLNPAIAQVKSLEGNLTAQEVQCAERVSNPHLRRGGARSCRWTIRAEWTSPELNREPPSCQEGVLPLELLAQRGRARTCTGMHLVCCQGPC